MNVSEHWWKSVWNLDKSNNYFIGVLHLTAIVNVWLIMKGKQDYILNQPV